MMEAENNSSVTKQNRPQTGDSADETETIVLVEPRDPTEDPLDVMRWDESAYFTRQYIYGLVIGDNWFVIHPEHILGDKSRERYSTTQFEQIDTEAWKQKLTEKLQTKQDVDIKVTASEQYYRLIDDAFAGIDSVSVEHVGYKRGSEDGIDKITTELMGESPYFTDRYNKSRE